MNKLVSRVLLPLAIVAVGGVATRALVMSKPKAERKPAQASAPPVEVVRVQAEHLPAKVLSTGQVQPALEVTLSPEVAGRVVWRSDDLVPGGRFKKGAALLRIDGRDYELAIKQEEARVEKAELDLQVEAGRQGIAEREWKLLASGKEAPDLALRKPHLAAARLSLMAAKSGLERANLNLERTTVRAPWNAVVIQEGVEVGQVVAPGAQLARLVGTDLLWVRASVPVETLARVEIPGVNAKQGSKAAVHQELAGGRRLTREGEVVRLLGELDAKTRTAQLLIGIEDPFALAKGGGTPMLPGAFVDVEIEGKAQEGVIPLPRQAVVDGGTVWVVRDGKLASVKVAVQWGDADVAFVSGPLEDGEQVVTSRLNLPIEGMPVRIHSSRDLGRTDS